MTYENNPAAGKLRDDQKRKSTCQHNSPNFDKKIKWNWSGKKQKKE